MESDIEVKSYKSEAHNISIIGYDSVKCINNFTENDRAT